MSFSVKDSALKAVPCNPAAAFALPCIGHTLQHDFTAPSYNTGILWRDDNDGSHGVRRVHGTCMGRKKPREDSLHPRTARTDTLWVKELVKQHSCKLHSSTSPQILISSLRGGSSARPLVVAFIMLYKHTVSTHPAWYHSKRRTQEKYSQVECRSHSQRESK